MTRRTFYGCLVAICFISRFAGAQPSASPAAKTALPPTSAQKNLLGNLTNPDIVEGCGCFFQLPAEWAKKNFNRYIMKAELEGQPAYLNIDGKDVKLKLVDSTTPKEPKKGSRFTNHFSAPNLKVQVDYLVTRVCGPHEESCEYADIDAILSVDRGTDHQVMKVRGGCGC